jgi:hypothetical protein
VGRGDSRCRELIPDDRIGFAPASDGATGAVPVAGDVAEQQGRRSWPSVRPAPGCTNRSEACTPGSRRSA